MPYALSNRLAGDMHFVPLVYCKDGEMIRSIKDIEMNERGSSHADLFSVCQRRPTPGVVSLFLRLAHKTAQKNDRKNNVNIHEPKVDKDGKPLLCCTTALHRTPEWKFSNEWDNVIRDLFKIYDRYDVNYTDKFGYTHFHVACLFGCEAVVKKFLEFGQDPNLFVANRGDFPLGLALKSRNENMIKLLLRGGANPHSANLNGMTPLHVLDDEHCRTGLALKLFEMTDELNQPLQVNARDNFGNTPLHLAMNKGREKVAELLLRRGADLNLTNNKGLTPMHVIEMYSSCNLSKMLFNVSGDIRHEAQIDVRDKNGNSPLHWALYRLRKPTAEMLLRNGANVNLTNDEGSTPLHIICQLKNKGYHDYRLAELFFKVTDEINQLVQVDVQDNEGRTPLQYAVASLMPNTVDLLLNHGASLSSFTFPDESCFVPESYKSNEMYYNFHSKLVSRAMLVVEHLEKRGYELDRSEALIIMKLFAQHESFRLDQSWRNDEDFVRKAKKMMIKPSLSLYDLLLLRPKEATRKLTFKEFYEEYHSQKKCSYSLARGQHVNARSASYSRASRVRRDAFWRLSLTNFCGATYEFEFFRSGWYGWSGSWRRLVLF
ncbi:unnamed protein product, partial [Trichogramma brassicae]